MSASAGSDRAYTLALNGLPEEERRILELMALVAEPAPRTGWVRWLVAAGVRGPKGLTYSALDLIEVFARLMRLGLVNETVSALRSHPEYAVEPARLHKVLATARAAGKLDATYQRVARYQANLDDADHNPARQIARDALALMHGCKVNPSALLARGSREWLKRDIGLALVSVLGRAAPLEGLLVLPEELRSRYVRELASCALEEWLPVSAELETWAVAEETVDVEVRAAFALARVLRGEALGVLKLLKTRSEPSFIAVRAVAHLSLLEVDAARSEARLAVDASQSAASKRGRGVHGVPGLFAWLLLTTDRDCDRNLVSAQASAIVAGRDSSTSGAADALQAFEELRRNDNWPDPHKTGERFCSALPHTWIEALFWGFSARAASAKWESTGGRLYRELIERTAPASKWLACELEALLESFNAPGAALPLLYTPEALWERTLSQIETALVQSATITEPEIDLEPSERMVWCLSAEAGVPSLSARMQTRSAKGFSAGRRVLWASLPELRNRADLLIEQDRPVIHALMSTQGVVWRGQPFDNEAGAMLELIGHPRVFGDHDAREPVDVALGAPRFQVREEGELLRISIEPRECIMGAIHAEREGRRLILTAFDARQRAIAASVARGDLVVPASARDRVERLVAGALASFSVSSDVCAQVAAVPRIAADARIHVALFRRARGLRVRLRVRPLANGPHFRPGEGPRHVLGSRADAEGPKHVQTERDFEAELAALDGICAEVDSFKMSATEAEEITFEDPLACLDLVNQLRLMGELIAVEWPEGQPLQVVGERGARDLSLKLTNADYWLSASGELTVDDGLKLGLRELLSLYQKAEGRFIPLDDQRYLALDESLRRELEGLSQFAHEKGKSVLVHPLALAGLSTWAIDVKTLDLDKGVEKRLARVREAETLLPVVSKQLHAELRPYQIEGFEWMSRLAHWGAGICLADDMGLGKTLQTLALLLEHAAEGPSLVVAPMSVCRNWIDETSRFAPSLRVVQLGTDDREAAIASLGPQDLLVCSYGVMQQEIERLSTIRFRVAVLDEAQAIKNAATRRARAAMQLVGEVRVALTGTPVENHLGEIWSIMTFLNPGLLGGVKDFERRFARPIQRDGDQQQAERLKQIIRPFVLRRRKSQVLKELPEKTVITLEVEPSMEEAALFAALREQARTRIQDPSKPNEMRFRLLAEITRMRRAACHPALVAPEANLESSKLATFETLVQELREGGHRALVFSQFVDYLTLVRTRLDELGVSYQYLDGSSTAKKRADAVRNFQAGESELFLISLKAGGFGLNLTAADYVIHLDPWWNPAVEDQASDRAHRIGQTRPVTVYRLVMRTTIEQKILSLHESKREIADHLLAGTEQSEKLRVEDLVALLNDE